MQATKQRLLIFIVAYNAEKTIQEVLYRLPAGLLDDYDVEVLIIDDKSIDNTFQLGHSVCRQEDFPFKLQVLFNPVNQGYGGNQKIGFRYAIDRGFDFVALVHGDGQYAPECLPELVKPLSDGQADAVFGSRMMSRTGAIKGGMPLYKYIGNRLLTWFQNRTLGVGLSEFHSGYRVYAVRALRRIPFHLNANVFHFDTEIIIQLVIAGQRIKELPIPTYYGDEICHVNGLKYAWDVVVATAKARLQEMSLCYDRKYDCAAVGPSNLHYKEKLDYPSSHTFVLERVTDHARILDLGCAGGYLDQELRKRGCHVTGSDLLPLADGVDVDAFLQHDLNAGMPPLDLCQFDYLLLLDVIEHLISPEQFVERLRDSVKLCPKIKIIVSTGNVGFILTRLGLLLGQFNYGKRGILDITHTRLFTLRTVRRLFEQGGFDVVEWKGVPVPFPLALRNRRLARMLVKINSLLVGVWPCLFAFQAFLVVQPRPSLDYLLKLAETESEKRAEGLEVSVVKDKPEEKTEISEIDAPPLSKEL
jgi:glycosyltransferase involved in cell wall biosynthesis